MMSPLNPRDLVGPGDVGPKESRGLVGIETECLKRGYIDGLM